MPSSSKMISGKVAHRRVKLFTSHAGLASLQQLHQRRRTELNGIHQQRRHKTNENHQHREGDQCQLIAKVRGSQIVPLVRIPFAEEDLLHNAQYVAAVRITPQIARIAIIG
jgi:hypothetical protein